MQFRGNGIPSPCMNCERKGCGAYHSECEEYKIFQEKCKKRNQDERAYKRWSDGYSERKKR